MSEPLLPPRGLVKALMPPERSAKYYGWVHLPTPRIQKIVDELNERGIETKITETEQFKAVAWLQGLSLDNMVLLNTARSEELFCRIATIQMLFVSDGVPSVGELRKAREALLDALAHQKQVAVKVNAVPRSVRRFAYKIQFEDAMEGALSAITARLEIVESELGTVEAFIAAFSGKINTRGAPPNWVHHYLVRDAADIFLSVTGYRPARNLPVRSFEGFLTRFCNGIPGMDSENFGRLADIAIKSNGYKGTFFPFGSEAEKNLWLSTGKRGTEYQNSG
ncbi:hypothetical protein [Ruegeria sp. HKCCC2117]|nr:hypothetical protein [Ruegeria sp. HKCCC2117]